MSAVLDSTGLTTQTFDEILEEIIVAMGAALSLTDAQTNRMRTGVQSTLGQIVRVEAERDAIGQEALLTVYNALSFQAEGAQLDRVVRLLGMTRIPEERSLVIGTATGTATTVIPTGARLQYNPRETVWLVVDGPYVIGGGGTVEIQVESEIPLDNFVALDPDSGFDDWTILDTVVGWSDVGAFESTEQPIDGHAVETDAALRSRAEVEAFRRGQGPLKAIEASIRSVTGVTYARVYENRTLVTDSDGIPGKAINAVVEGGADADVAEAIFLSRSAGAEVYGTDVTEDVVDDWGFSHAMAFDRVDDVPIWIRATLTTSTSEETPPPDIEDTVDALLLEFAEEQFGIGDDVLPWRLAAVVHVGGYPGIDDVLIELSDDGVSWQTTKYAIGIRERATFTAGNTSVVIA
jgi:hypothetical protein